MTSRRRVTLIGPELGPLLELSLLIDKQEYGVYVIEARHPVERLLDGAGNSDAAIVRLSGDENVVDLRRALDAFTGDVMVLLAPSLPVRAAMARIMTAYGATVLRADEPPLFIVATLIALMSARLGASA
jgi:hypothetical protein